MTDCIFCKIATGQIPSRQAYADDEIVVFHDIRPAAKVHLLMIPRKHIDTLAHCTADDQALLGKMLLLAPKLAAENGLGDGFKTAINTGRGGGQEVFHLHLHVFGGGSPD